MHLLTRILFQLICFLGILYSCFPHCDVFVQQIVPPVLNSFSIQDSRVRYYACEALYNIAKVRMHGITFIFSILIILFNFTYLHASLQVVRGDFIVFFNQIFNALCKLSADSDPNVQSAAHLLDRLVKVINSSIFIWPFLSHF